jgi:KUP system potassium uptake protein
MERDDVAYYVGRRSPIPVVRGGMPRWRVVVFDLLSRNAPSAEAEFRIPPENVVELGIPVEI